MKRVIVSLAASSVFLIPLSTAAHETQQFRIGGTEYKFVVGSLNEPLVVDDKSGLDLSISKISATGAMSPVSGLEQTLNVELAAADKKKEMNISAQYGKPGTYSAPFFPTVQTTLTYRIFGTINGQEIDLSFACNPAGHPATEEDRTEVDISDAVTRTLKRGAFGCPIAKADLGFPEPSASMYELRQREDGVDTGMIGMILGGLGLIAGIGAWMKKR